LKLSATDIAKTEMVLLSGTPFNNILQASIFKPVLLRYCTIVPKSWKENETKNVQN